MVKLKNDFIFVFYPGTGQPEKTALTARNSRHISLWNRQTRYFSTGNFPVELKKKPPGFLGSRVRMCPAFTFTNMSVTIFVFCTVFHDVSAIAIKSPSPSRTTMCATCALNITMVYITKIYNSLIGLNNGP